MFLSNFNKILTDSRVSGKRGLVVRATLGPNAFAWHDFFMVKRLRASKTREKNKDNVKHWALQLILFLLICLKAVLEFSMYILFVSSFLLATTINR